MKTTSMQKMSNFRRRPARKKLVRKRIARNALVDKKANRKKPPRRRLAIPRKISLVTPQTASQIAPQTVPPEAYAAAVRIYMDWMEREVSDQVDLVKKNVRAAGRSHSLIVSSSGLSTYGFFGQKGSILYGAEFEEYVNQVWIDFTTKCSDVDKFANYLQKEFNKRWSRNPAAYLKKCQKRFNQMRENFLKKVFAEWDLATQSLNGKALNDYLNDQYAKRSAEFEAMKKRFEESVLYPSLGLLLRKPAQNMISRQRYAIKNSAEDIDSLDEKSMDIMPFEERIDIQDIIDWTLATFSEQDKKIFELWVSGYKITEIAEELGKANSTVSTHLQNIISKIRNQIQE